ncbi:hypothetical protein ACFXKJ_40800 [Kitasatospora indigofera]|uniref:hypothetical protein n=1 Tax=Kitasatospora indigofera TaxID=67307 RepID=UPI0036CD3E3B
MNNAPAPAATNPRTNHTPTWRSNCSAKASTAASHPSEAPPVNGATAKAQAIDAASHAPMIIAWYLAFSTCAAVSRTPDEMLPAASTNAAIPESSKTRRIIASCARRASPSQPGTFADCQPNDRPNASASRAARSYTPANDLRRSSSAEGHTPTKYFATDRNSGGNSNDTPHPAHRPSSTQFDYA